MGNKQSSRRDQNPPPSEILEFHPIKQNESGMQNEKSTRKAYLKLRSWCSRIRTAATDAIEQAAECEPYMFLPKYENEESVEGVQAGNIQSRNDRRGIVKNLVGELQGPEGEVKEEELKKEEEKKQAFTTESATTNTWEAEEELCSRNFVKTRLLSCESPVPQIPNVKPKIDAPDAVETWTIPSLARRENNKRDELERLVDARLRDTPKRAYQFAAGAPVAQITNVRPTADARDKLETWTIPIPDGGEDIPWLDRKIFESRAHPQLKDNKKHQSTGRAFATKSATTNSRTAEEELCNRNIVPPRLHSRETSEARIEIEKVKRPDAVRTNYKTSYLLGKEAPVGQIPKVKPTADASDSLISWAIPTPAKSIILRDKFERFVDARLSDTQKEGYHTAAKAPVAQIPNLKPTADALDTQKSWTIPTPARREFATKSATTNSRTAEEELCNRNFVQPRLHSRETSEVRIEIEKVERPDAVKPKYRTSNLLGKEAPVGQIPNVKPTADASDSLKSWAIPTPARRTILRDEFERFVDARLRDTQKVGYHTAAKAFATKSATTNTRTGEEELYYRNFVQPRLHSRETSEVRIEIEKIERPDAVRTKCKTSNLLAKEAPVAQIPNVKPTVDASDTLKSWVIPTPARRETISWLGRDEFERRVDSQLRDIKEYQSGSRTPVAQILNVKPTTDASDKLNTRTIPSLARRDNITWLGRDEFERHLKEQLKDIKEYQSASHAPWIRTQITQPTPEAPASISYAKVTSSAKISGSTAVSPKVLLQDPQKPKTETLHSHAQKAAVPQVQHNGTAKHLSEGRKSVNAKSERKLLPVQHKRPATQVKSTSSKKKQRTKSRKENSKPVQRILTRLKYVNKDSSSRKERVDRFLAETKKVLERMNCDIMKKCTFYPAGSSFEGTAINRSADFDMLLILPEPYRGDHFQALESRYPGYYKLKWKEAFDYDNHYGYDDDDYFYDEDEYDDEEYDGNDEYNNNQEYDDEDDEYDVHVEHSRHDSQEDCDDDFDDEYDEYEEDEDDEEDYWDENANVDFAYTDWPKYVRHDGILKTFELLQYIFKKLEVAMNEINSMNHEWKLTYRPQFTSFIVFLKDSDGNSLKVDIVPQIGKCDWKGLPGLRKPKELARPFHECLSDGSIQFPIFFSLVPAPYMLKQQDGKCLVTTAFSMMERHCLQSSDVVRNAVIFAKLLSKHLGWKKSFGLRPFHMKRVAAKHLDELNDLPSWNAFIKLLEYLSAELRNGGIEGYFIKKQIVFSKAVRTELAEAIDTAKISVTPKDLIRKPNNNV